MISGTIQPRWSMSKGSFIRKGPAARMGKASISFPPTSHLCKHHQTPRYIVRIPSRLERGPTNANLNPAKATAVTEITRSLQNLPQDVLRVFMVNDLVFWWPKTFIFHGFGGSWKSLQKSSSFINKLLQLSSTKSILKILSVQGGKLHQNLAAPQTSINIQ